MSNGVKINPDLIRERKKCTFDLNELTNLIDGGKDFTVERKRFGKFCNSLIKSSAIWKPIDRNPVFFLA